jgi:hypothetical protein
MKKILAVALAIAAVTGTAASARPFHHHHPICTFHHHHRICR